MKNSEIRDRLGVLVREKRLVELFPAVAEKAKREVNRVVDENTTRHSLNLDAKTTANLKRAKEVFSHKFPQATDAEILSYALEFLLEKKDPARRPATSAGGCLRSRRAPFAARAPCVEVVD